MKNYRLIFNCKLITAIYFILMNWLLCKVFLFKTVSYERLGFLYFCFVFVLFFFFFFSDDFNNTHYVIYAYLVHHCSSTEGNLRMTRKECVLMIIALRGSFVIQKSQPVTRGFINTFLRSAGFRYFTQRLSFGLNKCTNNYSKLITTGREFTKPMMKMP